MPEKRNLTHALVLLAGVLLVASASIMIRQAQLLGVPSPVIAVGRVGFAALLLSPIAFVRARSELRTLHRRDVLLGLGSGVCLALHFSAWVASLEYTSVASSAALVTTNPLWIALASMLLFRQRFSTLTWLGVLLTIGGSVLIAISDSDGSSGSHALLGDGLALLGAPAGRRQMRGLLATVLALALAACGGREPYHRKDGGWWFHSERMDVPKGETLTALNGPFARSKTVAFYQYRQVPHADAASF
ncbi:MAG: DMT family transporter, partial [Roseiflexaceae bacterium]